MIIIIEPHNPAWFVEFKCVEKELQDILADVPIVSIEHLGSTSIPDLLAKPILDIIIIVTVDNLNAACDAMAKGGYEARGDRGIPHRYAFQQPGYQTTDPNSYGIGGKNGEMKRHTYIAVDGCLSTRSQRDLKRVLLENDELRHEYGNLKKKLVAGGVENINDYCKGKTETILKILKEAGWNDEDLEEVRRVNL